MLKKPSLNSLAPPLRATGDSLVHSADIHRFLQLYDAALESCDGSLVLFSLPGAVTFASRDRDVLAYQAARWAAQNLNVYIHVHLHSLPQGELHQRGSIDTARAAIGLFSDIDARGPGRKKPPETLCPTVQDAITVVEQFNTLYNPLRVSLIIGSGYGCYPSVLLKEPLLVNSVEDKKLLESLGRRFHQALHTIAAKDGWTGCVDFCDLAKVLRVPGSVNFKDPNNPQPVRIVYEDSARFTLADIDELLPPIGRNLYLGNGSNAAGDSETPKAVDPNVQIPLELVQSLRESHPLFAATWDDLRPDLDDQSCSGYDMALAGMGVACGLTDQMIASLIVAHRAKFPRPKKERRGESCIKYVQRTIVKARAGKQSSEAAEREWAALEAAIGTPASAVVTPDGISLGSSSDLSAPEQPVDGPKNVPDEPAKAQPPSEAPTDAPTAAAPTAKESDPAGAAPEAVVHTPAQFLLAQVRATGDAKVVYENITTVAMLSDAGVATLYQDLKTALGSKLNYHHFNSAVRDARAQQRRKRAEQQGLDPRPTIRTDDRLLDEIAAEAIAALEAGNQPPEVFRRGGALVLIHPDEDGRPVIMRATEAMMRGRLARVARFMCETKRGIIRVSPPEDVTRDVLTSNDGHFPPLGVVTQIPVLRADGSLRIERGYDSITRAYYSPAPGFDLGSMPVCPTVADAQAAVRFLDEAIGEFPFESPADKANCIALLLTATLRIAFRFKVPLALIDAPKWGTGKTLLAMLVYVVMTGSEGTVCAAPTNEEEWRKRLTSLLERGSAVTILDNVDQPLRSSSLSAVLTAPYWEDRILGRSEDIRLPNVSTWIATGNNLTLGGEMARRAYRIRLDAKVANPAGRAGFKRTDQELLNWTAAHRGELVASLLTMIRAWFSVGQPAAEVRAFGSFNSWARTVGAILTHAGVNGFLDNLETVQREADEESQEWEQFLRALVLAFGGHVFTASTIVDRVLHERGPLGYSFPGDIGHPDEHAGDGQVSLQRRLGKALARKCGTRFGELELRIERAEPDKHTKVQRWRVDGNVAALLSSEDKASAGFRNEE